MERLLGKTTTAMETVPTWSITEAAAQFAPNVQTRSFPGDHVGLLSTDAFRQFLYSYFGLSGPAPLVEDGPGVYVSLNKRTYRPGEAMNVLLIPDEEASVCFPGSLILSRVATKDAKCRIGRSPKRCRGFRGPARSLPSRLIAPTTLPRSIVWTPEVRALLTRRRTRSPGGSLFLAELDEGDCS